jgi:Zn-dependent metalloprotease
MKRTAGLVAAAVLLFIVAFPSPAADDRTYLERISGEGGALVSRSPQTGLLSFVGTAPGSRSVAPAAAAISADPAIVAREQVRRFTSELGLRDVEKDLTVARVRKNERRTVVRFQQNVGGIPVIAGDVVVNTTPAGELMAMVAKTTDLAVAPPPPQVTESAAAQSALGLVARKYHLAASALRASSPQQWIFDSRLLRPDGKPPALVWRLEVTAPDRPTVDELVLVDAATGAIVTSWSQVPDARNRETFDANSNSILPGAFVCGEATPDCTGGANPDADAAHVYAGDVYDFYQTRFGRDSIDALGMTIASSVRYCDIYDPCPYQNAFWSALLGQMIYGAGMAADDVTGHEITHGVTSFESNLFYFGEPGAINESLSDVFGELIDLTNGRGNDSPSVRWLMGEDTPMGAIRSMSNPPAFGQPDRKLSSLWYTGGEDSAGVHTNSGVGNKAAFLIVDGGAFNGKTVTGIGIEKAAQIYYEAQVALITSGTNYGDLYNALYQACNNLIGFHGITAADCAQVRTATQAVEMNAASPASSAVALCPAGSDNYTVLGYDGFDTGGADTGTLSRLGVGANWYLDSAYYSSPPYSALALDVDGVTDTKLTYQITTPVQVGDRIYFEHRFDTDYRFDGGVVEYSTNGGSTWVDAASLRVGGQAYNASIVASTPYASSPLLNRMAFTGYSGGWTYTMYDISTLAGKTVQWRFRFATDQIVYYYGWNIDELYHYHCSNGSLQMSEATKSVVESMGSAVITVNRNGGAAGAATVAYSTVNGTAHAGVDFTAVSGTLSWAAGDAHPKTITVPIVNRAGIQGDRSFQVHLGATTGAPTVGTPGSTTVTITDNDGAVGFDTDAVTVNENGPNVTINVVRTGFPGPAASVTWTTVAGTAGAADFTARSGTLTWPAGDASPRTIVIGPVAATGAYVPITNDTLIEGPESFTVKLSAPSGAVLGSTSVATVTIVSDDRGIAMSSAAQTVAEAAGTVAVQVQRLGPPAGAVSVNYSTSNGTAVAGTHYTATSGTLAWADGDAAPQSIVVPIIDNAAVNANRTFMVNLSGPSGATLGSPGSTTVTIADDDNTLQFSAPTATVTEGTAALTLTVTRVGGLATAASVTWTTADGTALAGTDFGTAGDTTPLTGTLSWPAGTGGAKTLSIPIINDTIVEGAKTFTVNLSNPSGATLGAAATATVTVNDNDSGLAFAAAGYSIAENGGNVVLKVNRIGPVTAAASVQWTTSNGTAIAGQDFGSLGVATQRSGTLTWAAGDGTAKSITIPILNDVVDEPDETFTVTLSSPSAGIVLGTPSVATVTILDDDIPPESQLSFTQAPPKYLVLENAGNATLSVSRDALPGGGFARAASVSYATSPGTALVGSDYTTRTGTLTWAAGESGVKTISVPITNDTIAEPTETFKVTLSGVTPGTSIATPEATVLILDDDEKFPPQGAIPGTWTVPVAATAGWHVSADPGPFEGVYSLRTDQVGDNETAQIQVAGTFVAGTASFRVRVSSEPGFDVLRFYVDGVKVQEWSGITNTAWQMFSTPIAAGAHTLMWSYEKDGSAAFGQDAAWLDGVTLPGMTP